MSVLLIGGDKVSNITELLKNLGVTKTTHWDSRKNSTSHKKIPANTNRMPIKGARRPGGMSSKS